MFHLISARLGEWGLCGGWLAAFQAKSVYVLAELFLRNRTYFLVGLVSGGWGHEIPAGTSA
jgi:hypothetical protein